MKEKFKQNKSNYKKLIKKNKNLTKNFIDLYGKPVLIHSTHGKEAFLKIIKEGRLRTPKNHNFIKKNQYMEKILGIDNGLYYGSGFSYATDFNFKYTFLFDLDYINECSYFDGSLLYRCWREIARFWDANDLDYFMKLRNYNKATREVVDEFYKRKAKGKTKVWFTFFKIEDILIKFFNEYPRKKELVDIILNQKKKLEVKYPQSKVLAAQAGLEGRAPETICFNDHNLLKSKYFLGFYIKGSVPSDVKKILRDKYQSKILFNGKNIEVII